ncbi:hypothetical protein MHLP_01690 [Candidatus Mycoplasma haematolamae str. Purdue]|uniref:Uncharacterized protein n=1 Tax=Mycoplasma haematolamae (strain Purdue) TaxID=1212765 RepID=I7BJA4_MYCHA|nr:hypothetical protein [Candidatus Mycoplasma haematolamae]AFO51918.1 hypothetical protein MHLP_01690 [Candidatus Mycoplasma haematolamae str. Purdue]
MAKPLLQKAGIVVGSTLALSASGTLGAFVYPLVAESSRPSYELPRLPEAPSWFSDKKEGQTSVFYKTKEAVGGITKECLFVQSGKLINQGNQDPWDWRSIKLSRDDLKLEKCTGNEEDAEILEPSLLRVQLAQFDRSRNSQNR